MATERHNPNMFVGVGPGRCGTLSLVALLHGIKGVQVTHEGYKVTRAGGLFDGVLPADAQWMLSRFSYHTTQLEGYVGALWTGFVPLLRLQFPALPVICLHRDKDEVIRSFIYRQAVRDREEGYKQPWLLNIGGATARIDENYIAGHWEWCEALMKQIKPPVLHLDVNDLNDDDKLTDIFDFLYIPQARRVYPKQRVHHKGDYTVELTDAA